MHVSLKAALPAGYDTTRGLRGLRVRDNPPISLRSLTQLVSWVIHANDMNTGHVYSSKVMLQLWGDGSWSFWGDVSDTSAVYGDNFAIGFVFQDGGYAGIKSGTLGGGLTRPPQHDHFSIVGRSEGLQRNYHQVIDGSVQFMLHRSDDLSQVFNDLVTDLKKVWQQIELWISYDSNGQGAQPSTYSPGGDPLPPGPEGGSQP